MANQIIIPDGQSIRWVLNNYYQQPEGSNISEAQSIHHRNYFNTLFRNEVEWNQDIDAQLYGHLWGNNRERYVQNLRDDTKIKVLLRHNVSHSDLIGTITLQAYLANGELFGTVVYSSDTTNIDNVNYGTNYQGSIINIVNISGKVGVYFSGTGNVFNSINGTISVSYSGNVPNTISVGDTCTLFAAGNGFTDETIQSIVYDETVNANCLLFDVPFDSGGQTSGTFIHTYKRSEFNTTYITLTESDLPENQCFYLALNWYSDKAQTTLLGTWESEYLIKTTDIPNSLKFEWGAPAKVLGLLEYRFNKPNIFFSMYLPAQMYPMNLASDNSEIYKDQSAGSRLLRNKYGRRYTLTFEEHLPRYVFDTLAIAMRHEYFYINNKRYVCDPATFNVEPVDGSMMFTASVEVTEYATTGVYDTDGYDFTHTIPSPYEYLKIDSNNYLKIDENNKLRIGEI